jgi:hypothetical protein
MAHLKLNCPQCQKQLVYVPLEGLTLYYRCGVHGPFILKPLVVLDEDAFDSFAAAWPPPEPSYVRSFGSR